MQVKQKSCLVNPDTQDFQVWHLYRNGAKTRVLDLRTNLQAPEAQWAFDNNIPKSWSPSDWQNPDGKQQKANEIPLNQVGENQEQTEEDNVTETKEETPKTEQVSQEENNVEETSQDTQGEEVEQEEDDNVHDFVMDYYDTKDDEEADAAITNSVDKEEDNVVDTKKKKSKYNGMNVTGCAKPDGTVVMATWIKQNLMDFYNAMAKKDIKGEPEKQLNNVMKAIKDILSVNPKLASEMTKQSTDNLTIDFSVVPNANMKYVITLEFTEDGVNVSGSGLPEKDKLGFTLDCLNKVIKTISGIKHTNHKP